MTKSTMSRRQLLQFAATLPLSLSVSNAFAKTLTADPANIGSITSIAPRIAMQGKLATKTEILVGQGQAPMLTLGSMAALQGAIQQYQQISAAGGWQMVPPGKYDKSAQPGAVAVIRRRLVAEGYLPADTLNGAWDVNLIAAIKAFQYNHGALPTGRIDERTKQEMNISADARLYTLQENAPRIAEHMRDLGPRYIAVNIPGAQLETVELGQLYSRHNVVVGKLDRPTPSLKSRVSDVIFNPTWNAPASIVAKDIIPKMLADRSYLRQMNLHIYDGGREIDPANVDWHTTSADRFAFRQESGDINSLGNVKINFPNNYMVYLHDTPHRDLFATNDRWESSGCVRVDKVKHLITWVLNGQYGYDEANYDPIIASHQTQKLAVARGPDVRFMYLTAWATEDGRVNFRPDVYKLDGKGFILGQPNPLIAG